MNACPAMTICVIDLDTALDQQLLNVAIGQTSHAVKLSSRSGQCFGFGGLERGGFVVVLTGL
jgi:hypothetical protein